MSARITVSGLGKSYVLHQQGGVVLPLFQNVALSVGPGECLVVQGASGAGKSTLLRCLYGNCLADHGSILIERDGSETLDLVTADPRAILKLRRDVIGYVSQFLRAIPRVSALDVVAEPLRAISVPAPLARERAAAILSRVNIPERVWSLAPATFSGGEQQRVNIARAFVGDHPILLLDEPTASLDSENRQAVLGLMRDALAENRTLVGVFHDEDVRNQVATRHLPM